MVEEEQNWIRTSCLSFSIFKYFLRRKNEFEEAPFDHVITPLKRNSNYFRVRKFARPTGSRRMKGIKNPARIPLIRHSIVPRSDRHRRVIFTTFSNNSGSIAGLVSFAQPQTTASADSSSCCVKYFFSAGVRFARSSLLKSTSWRTSYFSPRKYYDIF